MAWKLEVTCEHCHESPFGGEGYYRTKRAAQEAAEQFKNDCFDIEINREPLPEYAMYEEDM